MLQYSFVLFCSLYLLVPFHTMTGVCVVVSTLVQTVCVFFFFQAEDGIRDLVRSRGLGDVYKRQRWICRHECDPARAGGLDHAALFQPAAQYRHRVRPVSYTHLTLPTSDLV